MANPTYTYMLIRVAYTGGARAAFRGRGRLYGW